MQISCPSCHGTKEMLGLGNMKSRCQTCDATGTVDSEKWEKPVREKVNYDNPMSMVREFRQNSKDAERERLKTANVAHLNRPATTAENKDANLAANQRPPVPLLPGIKQAPSIKDNAAPKPISDMEAMRIRAEIVPAEDTMMASQTAELQIESKDLPTESKAKGKRNGKKEAVTG